MADKRLLDLAMTAHASEYEGVLAEMTEMEAIEVVNRLDLLAQQAVHVAEYLAMRSRKVTHENALDAAHRYLRKIRKAMGYTHP